MLNRDLQSNRTRRTFIGFSPCYVPSLLVGFRAATSANARQVKTSVNFVVVVVVAYRIVPVFETIIVVVSAHLMSDMLLSQPNVSHHVPSANSWRAPPPTIIENQCACRYKRRPDQKAPSNNLFEQSSSGDVDLDFGTINQKSAEKTAACCDSQDR